MLRALDLTNIVEVDLSIDDVQLMDVFERLTERRCELNSRRDLMDIVERQELVALDWTIQGLKDLARARTKGRLSK